MKKVDSGKILNLSDGVTDLLLPSDSVVIWRESVGPEAIVVRGESEIPPAWRRDTLTSWKILGAFDLIKKLFPGFKIPAGSKVIGLLPGAEIRLDFPQKKVQFHGKRMKRVVVVDDSVTMRKLLRRLIESAEGWEVVKEVETAEMLPEALDEFYPDVVTLDLNLPMMNGAEAMKRILAPKRFPTLLVTSQSMSDGNLVMDALAAGAFDYLQKPEANKVELMKEELHLKLDSALRARWQKGERRASSSVVSVPKDYVPEDYLIVIGSSTGGTQALQEIFTKLPAKIPPILVTQHIPAGFSKALADRLNGLCPFEIKEAKDGDKVKPGCVLIAPGDHHLALSKDGESVNVISAEPVNRFRPSVDFMFDSVVKSHRTKVIAIMLTGMGKDGSQAMLSLRNRGAITIAQDEASSVVFGMPKEAIRIGAVEHVVALEEIPSVLMSLLRKKR
jgi:two-component system chemotaxis response regulator CheB